MDKTAFCISQLRNAIVKHTNRCPATPKDFDCLAADIYERLHEGVSASTLKRIWGYVEYGSMPRVATLNVLARFVGYSDWQDFCRSVEVEGEEDVAADGVGKTDATAGEMVTESNGGGRDGRKKWAFTRTQMVMGVALLVAVLLLVLMMQRGMLSPGRSGLVLRAGQTFAAPEDYLALFGIVPSDHSWDEPLPHHQGVIVWSPWYQHPNWHNEGDPERLFPTITEWWTPTEEEADSVSPLVVKQRNENLFFTVTRTNELRITFMRGIAAGDSATFLGVYRLDLHRSDSTHLVWQRMTDLCDLGNLDYLEELRNR